MIKKYITSNIFTFNGNGLRNFILTLILTLVVFMILYVNNMEPINYINLVENISDEEMAEIKSVRQISFDYAVSCSEANIPISFSDITWNIHPDKHIRFTENKNYLDLAGWYDPDNDIVWIAYPYRKTSWVNSHEVLHKLGFKGHGAVFANCNLLADQQP